MKFKIALFSKNLVNYFSNIKSFILDLLFPVSCLSCGREGFWYCEECLQKIDILSFQVCPCCEKIITDQGKVCPNCKKRREKASFCLDALVVATKYDENYISKTIHNFKYNFIQDLSLPLGNLLVKSLLKSELPLPDFIVPVPLHPRRLRWRGFNQSELLARHISQQLAPGFEIPILGNILIRKKYTRPQMEIKSYRDRQINVQTSFVFRPKFSETIRNKKILLIDDVATTAATLLACAGRLKENGANKVFATVIARQQIEKRKD